MDKLETLSDLIGQIYDAALEPTLWNRALGRAAAFVGGVSASLYSKDAASKNGEVFYEDGWIDRRYKDLYFEKYIKLDPTTTGQFFAEIGQPMATADIIPYDEFLETRFYKEWAKPQQLVDHLVVVLDKSVTSIAMLGVFLDHVNGVADQAKRERMLLIAPHIRRAILIGRLIDLRTGEAASFADTLDGISAGMFLVNAAGQIVHSNRAGHATLEARDCLYSANGRLAARDSQLSSQLHEVIAAAASGDGAVGVKGISLPLIASDGERHVIHVLPLTSGTRRQAGTTYAAVAALFMHKATVNTPSAPEAIAKAYKLTPTELRILLAVVEIGGVPEVAVALGISPETVKTHVSRLYEKTGARRQLDLAKLLAGFASPLVG